MAKELGTLVGVEVEKRSERKWQHVIGLVGAESESVGGISDGLTHGEDKIRDGSCMCIHEA